MSAYKIQEETLKGLGDSVRAITGSSDSMTPTIMKENLDKVAQDINQTTVTSVDVSYGEIAYGKDGKVTGTSPIVHVDGDGICGEFPSKSYFRIRCFGGNKFNIVWKR